MPHSTIDAALNLKELLIRTSPLIEEYTRAVCPACTDVCCKQKHCVYRERDVIYLKALGMEIPPHDATRPQECPCQFLETSGCTLPRWRRPFKCTWYFCEPIIKAMEEGPPKTARTLLATLQEMIPLFDQLKEGKDNHE